MTIEEIRAKIESHMQIERAAVNSWKGNQEPYKIHNAKLEILQKLLTGKMDRKEIQTYIRSERATIKGWKPNQEPYNIHNAKLAMLQELLTYVDSGGADAL